jgi:hypothetical protein
MDAVRHASGAQDGQKKRHEHGVGDQRCGYHRRCSLPVKDGRPGWNTEYRDGGIRDERFLATFVALVLLEVSCASEL